jgi:DNA end-binding protein Ku
MASTRGKASDGKAAASKPAARKAAASKAGSGQDRKRSGGASSALGSRPLWSGNLRLALVSVPVKLFAATSSGARISFHQVHEPSGKRVRYEKVVPGIGPIDTDEIVKGFELDKGRYVLIDPEEIDALKLEAKKTLDLVQFVRATEISPIWFDRPYYVVADGELAEEAYGVLRDALRRTELVGLGQFVMRGREYIAALKPCGNGLLLETLRFADEVRTAAPFFASVDDVEPDEELLELAVELIQRKSAPFEPERFADSYTAAVRELIEAKAKKKKPIEVGEPEPSSGAGKVIDLVEALKKSVERGGKATPGNKASPGKRQSAASRRKAG